MKQEISIRYIFPWDDVKNDEILDIMQEKMWDGFAERFGKRVAGIYPEAVDDYDLDDNESILVEFKSGINMQYYVDRIDTEIMAIFNEFKAEATAEFYAEMEEQSDNPDNIWRT